MIRKISDILREKERTYSFELFPPKTEKGRERLPETAGTLKELEPDWFAVTYGAGGTTRELTIDIVDELQERFQVPTMHHFTCVGHSKAELEAIIKKMKEKLGIDFGSGYPSDPRTVDFLKENWDKFPSLFRKSWVSYKKVVKGSKQRELGEF